MRVLPGISGATTDRVTLSHAAASVVGAGRRRIPGELWRAEEEAGRILSEARGRAEALVEEARAAAAAIRSRAAAEGDSEARALAVGLFARAALTRDRLLARAAPDVLELAWELTRRVLGRVAESDRRVVVECAERALELVPPAEQVTLVVHPLDVPALDDAAGGALVSGRADRRLVLRTDPGMERGGVLAESALGKVDARLSVQLGALCRALTESP